MARSARISKYRRHSSGQARVTLDGKDHLLGPYNLIAEWATGQGSFAPKKQTQPLLINELILAYWKFAKDYYGFDGKRGDEPTDGKTAVKDGPTAKSDALPFRVASPPMNHVAAQAWRRRIMATRGHDLEKRRQKIRTVMKRNSYFLAWRGSIVAKYACGGRRWVLRLSVPNRLGRFVHRSLYLGSDGSPELLQRARKLLQHYRALPVGASWDWPGSRGHRPICAVRWRSVARPSRAACAAVQRRKHRRPDLRARRKWASRPSA